MGNPIVRRRPNTEINPNKLQSKYLPSNLTTNGLITSLSFNNLQVGKTYEMTGQYVVALDLVAVNDDAVSVDVRNGATIIQSMTLNNGAPDSQQDLLIVPINLKFFATATTLTFTASDLSNNSLLVGTAGGSGTYIQLEERNDVVDTTDFT